MKKFRFLAVILAAVLIMAGCTPTTSVMLDETNTNSKWEITYTKLDGKKSRPIPLVSDGYLCELNGEVFTEEGEVYVEVKDTKGNVVYTTETFTKNGEFHKTLESGKYTVYIVASNHKGGLTITWDNVEGRLK